MILKEALGDILEIKNFFFFFLVLEIVKVVYTMWLEILIKSNTESY